MNLCRFCQTPMLPIEDIPPESDMSVNHAMWECHACPATVKQYTDDPSWFSILTFFNGHWYEVMQMYTPAEIHKEPPLLSIYKYIMYQNDSHNQSIKSEFVLELSIEGNITPQNINQKLATILTFS